MEQGPDTVVQVAYILKPSPLCNFLHDQKISMSTGSFHNTGVGLLTVFSMSKRLVLLKPSSVFAAHVCTSHPLCEVIPVTLDYKTFNTCYNGSERRLQELQTPRLMTCRSKVNTLQKYKQLWDSTWTRLTRWLHRLSVIFFFFSKAESRKRDMCTWIYIANFAHYGPRPIYAPFRHISLHPGYLGIGVCYNLERSRDCSLVSGQVSDPRS